MVFNVQIKIVKKTAESTIKNCIILFNAFFSKSFSIPRIKKPEKIRMINWKVIYEDNLIRPLITCFPVAGKNGLCNQEYVIPH